MSKGRVDPVTRLTPRQKAFAESYAACGVAAQAARDAGYSAKRADQQGHSLLTDPEHKHVQAYIAKLRAKAAKAADVSIEKVIEEFSLLAFADLAEFVEWDGNNVTLKDSKTLDKAKRRAIIEVAKTRDGIRIKLADKTASLDRLGKYLGMFVDKVEHSGEVKSAAPVINLTLTKKDG